MHEPGTRTSDYDFDLPVELIAQRPANRRDASRLLIVDRASGTLEHGVFPDLEKLIPAGDILVANRSRVVRARLLGKRDSGAPAEVMLLRRREGDVYEAMVSPGAKLKPGRVVTFAEDFSAEILETTGRGTRLVRLRSGRPPEEMIERHGHIPLPPYIDRSDETEDAERYQTVYAREAGSVAAPTAGLHFTPELLARIEKKGVRRAEVVLHVGAGTFKPVEADDPAGHVMHEEVFDVAEADAAAINDVRRSGGKAWAVGTTTVRTLESIADDSGAVRAGSGDTRIFIRPPYRFRAVDHLITNFHLPRSTLMMLVAAFAGYDLTMRAYREAIARDYRFYSYGDAMVII
ncbi:MAG TPA: tRNA preQ1(34) S-adenosylmethionine ribosyltransferase-isomerase QueA [Gemmatimonadaceae bacterium]|nr:tRNA preQ1(34) S-adenosylmethionine ribosyltransferase-isomerase QueA [Gemmatimonadaceae bacterium]